MTGNNRSYHIPVMGQEVARYLIGNRDGIYLDGTLGGGGHASIIIPKLSEKAIYIGIDRDDEAIREASERLKSNNAFRAYKTTFDNSVEVLKKENVDFVDGILLDLGVSSWQIDQDSRGFSFRPGIDLDMRMDKSQTLTAKWILNNYSMDQLKKIFKEYGEERYSGKIAFWVTKIRDEKNIEKSSDLLKIIDKCVNPRFATKSYARIFQALRIEVNNELNILTKTLNDCLEFLALEGRLVVITYHSLEDRIVKNFMKYQEDPCECPPGLPVCVCGKEARLKRIKPFFIEASDMEIKSNPRARSAKLRIAEKIKE